MTPDRIAELRALAEKATPGPWETGIAWPFDENTYSEIRTPLFNAPEYLGYATLAPRPTYSRLIRHTGENSALRNEDAAFIAAARTALPEALDAIERVRAYAKRFGGTTDSQDIEDGILAALEGKSDG